jgi:hypothetical protein
MATIKNRIRRLQRQQRRRWCEESIRQFENRSNEELRFFALNGYFETSNHNQRVVKPEEIRAFEKSLYALGRGRTEAELKYYSEHGAWPEREKRPSE